MIRRDLSNSQNAKIEEDEPAGKQEERAGEQEQVSRRVGSPDSQKCEN
jgi:hypothetical protein